MTHLRGQSCQFRAYPVKYSGQGSNPLRCTSKGGMQRLTLLSTQSSRPVAASYGAIIP